eukprot:Rmarinus@m.23825
MIKHFRTLVIVCLVIYFAGVHFYFRTYTAREQPDLLFKDRTPVPTIEPIPDIVIGGSGLTPLLEKWSCDVLDPWLLFYNRVRKSGSTTLLEAINHLQVPNSFKWMMLMDKDKTVSDVLSQFSSAWEEAQDTNGTHRRFIFDKHFPFIENWRLTELNMDQISHLIILRDPVARVVSEYNYDRWGSARSAEKREQFLSIPGNNVTLDECISSYLAGERSFSSCVSVDTQLLHFCGSHVGCRDRNFGLLFPLQLAIKHAMRPTTIFGFLDEQELTFSMLEHRLPKYFDGLKTEVGKQAQHNVNTNKLPTSDSTLTVLRRELWREVYLYDTLKEVFYEQAKRCGLSSPTNETAPALRSWRAIKRV